MIARYLYIRDTQTTFKMEIRGLLKAKYNNLLVFLTDNCARIDPSSFSGQQRRCDLFHRLSAGQRREDRGALG